MNLFRALSENKELHKKIEGLESEKLKLNHEMSRLQSELSQTRETMGKLQIKQAGENQAQAEIESRMSKARQAYKNLKLQLQAQSQETSQAQVQIEEQKAQIDQLQLELSESRIKLPAVAVEEKKPKKTSIVIVDDSITTRTLMKKILETAHYDVHVAKDGLEGKTLVEKEAPDLVVTDIEMPNMDGFELTQWIKNSSAHPEIPVVMITSLDDEDFQSRGKEAGANSFITKNNFNQQSFLSIIKENLSD